MADDDAGRGVTRRWTCTGLTAVGAGIAVALAGVVGSQLRGHEDTPVDRPTAASPSPTGWTGPLRDGPALSLIPFVTSNEVDSRTVSQLWADGADAAPGGIDIRIAEGGGWQRPRWKLLFREAPPRASTLDPAQRVIAYGIVVDGDGDRGADCEIGINNDAARRGEFRVWVKNVRTGGTDERVGPPYGVPIEFSHPDEAAPDNGQAEPASLSFSFLGTTTTPCDPFLASASFYAWASVTEGGEVTGWDYAPDAAWLAMPPG
jgi:hypothetical protein